MTNLFFIMSEVISRVKSFLSDKKVSIAILVLSIAGRLIQVLYFFNIRSDRSFQMLATDNLLQGHGVSTAGVLANDLSNTVYTPLINWPPGYSLLIAPFYALFGRDYIAAGLITDMLCAVLLIIVSRSILKILNTPAHLLNIYTLIAGFFIYDFYFISSSDSMTITFFIIAIYYTLTLFKTNKHWLIPATGITVFLFICASLKYLFMPLVFIIPAFLILKGFVDRELRLKKAGIFSVLILSIGIGALLWYQKSISGSAAFISSAAQGFYPGNLLEAYPYFPASFIKPATVALVLNQPGAGTFIFHTFQWVHILFILFVLSGIARMFYRHGLKKISLTDNFFYLAFIISITLTLLLTFLSLKIAKAEEMPGSLWTFIQEPRYYGLTIVLIQLAVFVLCQYRARAHRFLKYAFYIFLLLLLTETFRGLIFDIKRIVNLKEEYSWQHDLRLQKYAGSLIDSAQGVVRVESIAVTGTSYYINNRVSLYSHIPIFHDVSTINDLTSLKTKKPMLLLIILHKNDFHNFLPFLSLKGKDAAGNFGEFSFYTAYVIPH